MAKTKGQLLSKIDYLFADIQSQYTEIKKSTDFDAVEVTLLEANLASLAKYFEALKIQNSVSAPKKFEPADKNIFTPATEAFKTADKQPVFEEIVAEEVLPAIPVSNHVEQEVSVPQTENPIASVSEVEVESKQEVLVEEWEEEIVEPVVVPAKEIEVSVEKVVTTNEEPVRPLTINELIQQQKQAGVNVTQQFQTSAAKDKVVDLKTAVSLNDKLLYIKDLFNGYSLAYSEAIELLNRFNSFAEADAFLQTNYALKNSWADKPQTVDKFYTLLQKKFEV